MAKTNFRPCLPQDVDLVVPLILESGPESFSYVFKNKDSNALDFLKFAFQREGGEFSYDNHSVLLLDGEVIGIGTAFDKKRADRFMMKEIVNILRFYKLKAFRVMILGLKIEQILKLPKKDEIYLGHLTVHEKFRSKGFGQQLINLLIQQNKVNTSTKIVLDVSEENPRAKLLYHRLGFRESNYVPSKLKNAYGYVPNFFRMELKL